MERRRAPRLSTNLWVGLPEVDGGPQLSKCNISVSGVLVQSRRDVGDPGVVRMLHLGRVGDDRMIEIMAHVVRVIACDDVKLGRVVEATAFEFLPEGNDQLRQIAEFVGQVAETEMASEPAAALDFSFPAQLTDSHDSAGAATVRALGVSGMIIEAPWAIEVAPFYGNGNLEAEESTTLEFGTSLYLGKNLTFNFEYFQRIETNAIGFKSIFDDTGNWIGGIYANIEGDREIDGIEMDVKWDINSDFSISGHAAFHNFGDPSQFNRIPEIKYGMSGNYTLNEKTNFQLSYTYFGERQDAIFTDPFMVTLEGYNMLDLAFSHELKKDKIFVTAAINNLLDEDFVGVYGFSTKPINFNIGFNVRF